jgi:peroxiredoxin
LQNIAGEFDKRAVKVIAVAQEDKDLESHAKMLDRLTPEPRFEIVADIDRAKSTTYKRITGYLIDKDGTVRQVFPQTIRNRSSWKAILSEIDRIRDDDQPGSP